MSNNWINVSPRGDNMPIGLEYPYSFKRPTWSADDLPPGFNVVARVTGHPDVQAFPTARLDHVVPILFWFLVNPDGEFVATWDEGRWWTPDESAAWLLMLQVPDTYVFAKGMREQQMPRWWRRAQRRKRK